VLEIPNYFDGPTKLFLDLYLLKFLGTSAKSFFSRSYIFRYSMCIFNSFLVYVYIHIYFFLLIFIEMIYTFLYTENELFEVVEY